MSNAEVRARWAVGSEADPETVALDELNPASGDWFEQHKELRLFQRLRQEALMQYTAETQFGAYWSLSQFDDVKYVDTHQQLFSSDIMKGGIRLGGQPLTQPPALFHLPMCIMQDQPMHDDPRKKVVAPMFTAPRPAISLFIGQTP